jgi:hypothetical protein
MLIFVITLFYWVQYESLPLNIGWPTSDTQPEKCTLIAIEVHEPNKSKGDEGVMYWWIREAGKSD